MKRPTVRISGQIPTADRRRMMWLARKRGVPFAAVLRDAVYAYVLPIAPDADADARRRSKKRRSNKGGAHDHQ